MGEYLGGRLDIHKHAAFWMLEEDDCYGRSHPRDAMLPELVTLVCANIRVELEAGRLTKAENERIYMEPAAFAGLVWECREKWKGAWSKECREMEKEKLIKNVQEYMKSWMMLRAEEEKLCILPAAGKVSGFYPADYKGGEEDK